MIDTTSRNPYHRLVCQWRNSAIRLFAIAAFTCLAVFMPHSPAGAQTYTNLLGNRIFGIVPTPAYQGEIASDSFSSIHYLGNGRIVAGKRSAGPKNRFLLSTNNGGDWKVVGCEHSTGRHTYVFGQNGETVIAGTGDTGNPCLMRSTDTGSTWSVALSVSNLYELTGSTNLMALFSPVYLGSERWVADLKSFDTDRKLIMSSDNGTTWFVPNSQPGQNLNDWARLMILSGDDVLLWPSCGKSRLFVSENQGGNWKSVTLPGAALFQPLCDAGNGIYFCGGLQTAPYSPISMYGSLDKGQSWTRVASVNLQRPTPTYWRDIARVGYSLFASACCVEGSSNERFMKLYSSSDDGRTWFSLGNPFAGPYGGMQAIYQMCATESNQVFAACQPDSTILTWTVPSVPGAVYCVSSLIPPFELTKCGIGTFTLDGSNTFSGSLIIEEGRLQINGSLTVTGDIRINGEIAVSGGALAAVGDIINNGKLLLADGAKIVAGRDFINQGTIYTIRTQDLPGQLINQGTVLKVDKQQIQSLWRQAQW